MRAGVYKARRAAKLCVHCGAEPARPGRAVGATCAKKQSRRDADRTKERRAAGDCITCGKKAAPDSARCKDCHDKYHPRGKPNVTHARRARRDTCRTCDGPLIGLRFSRCPDCRKAEADAAQARRAARLAVGLCASCGKRRKLPNLTRCGRCRRKHNGTSDESYSSLAQAS